MLDLIIPVYKNLPGLYRSLLSIGTEVSDKIYVTIVDDCSGENYDEVISIFQKFFPIRVIYLDKNQGPGVARQKGLDMATHPYVSFLDCGDTYISPTRLLECLNYVRDNPDGVFFSWSHLDEKTVDDKPQGYFIYEACGATNNRMHGKIYKRHFLMEHNITFSEKGSRMNEDIGFNIAVRVIAENQWRRDHVQRMHFIDEPVVVWKVTGPSVVRADDCAFYYRDQNMGMGLNGEHILNLLYKNNVDNDLILQELYEEMLHMYMFYCTTKNARPEYLEKCLEGAIYYYVNCFRNHKTDDLQILTTAYWKVISMFISDPGDPVRMYFYPIDFPAFLNMLEEQAIEKNLITESVESEPESTDTDDGINHHTFQYIPI